MSTCWWPDRPRATTRIPHGTAKSLAFDKTQDLVASVVGLDLQVADADGDIFRVQACGTVDGDGLHVRPLAPDSPSDWRVIGLEARVVDLETGATAATTVFSYGPYAVGAQIIPDGLPETWRGKGPRIRVR